jgi:hypothetical protein
MLPLAELSSCNWGQYFQMLHKNNYRKELLLKALNKMPGG